MNKYTFPIPANLNGEQLRTELGAELVYINEDLLYIVGDLTEAKAKAGIAAHIPAPIIPPTPLEKLNAAGLTLAELKALLA